MIQSAAVPPALDELDLAARVASLKLEDTVTAAAPTYDEEEIGAVLRRVAAAGFVLAKNDRGMLPLHRGRLHQLAVIGPNANAARTLGGGSATVFAPYTVSPLYGLRDALEPDVGVVHGAALRVSGRIPVADARWLHATDTAAPGVEVRFLGADGGLVEPGGRLPTTWPATESGLPSVRPVDGVLRYDEGLLIGYRGHGRDGRDTLFPFGHGLGFSSWEYESLDAPRRAVPGAAVRATVEVRNTGRRRSREVVKLYASRAESGIERPARWLIGFAAVHGDPGELATATIIVPPRAFEHWSVEEHRWALEPGTLELAAGPSSADLPMSTLLTVA